MAHVRGPEFHLHTTQDFLNAVKERHGLTTDYKLAKHWKCSVQNVSRYRTGKSTFSDDVAVRVANDLECEPMYVIACMNAERAERHHRTDDKQLWFEIAKRAVMTAMLFTTAGALSILASPAAEAARALCIMLSRLAGNTLKFHAPLP